MSVQQWANLKCESLQWTQAARGGAIKHMVATHKLPHQRHHQGFVVPLEEELKKKKQTKTKVKKKRSKVKLGAAEGGRREAKKSDNVLGQIKITK